MTFSSNRTLYSVECWVGASGQEEWAGWQAAQFEHEEGTQVWGYSQACSLYPEWTWSGFYGTIDRAYSLDVNGIPELVAQGSAAWAPGATI